MHKFSKFLLKLIFLTNEDFILHSNEEKRHEMMYSLRLTSGNISRHLIMTMMLMQMVTVPTKMDLVGGLIDAVLQI